MTAIDVIFKLSNLVLKTILRFEAARLGIKKIYQTTLSSVYADTSETVTSGSLHLTESNLNAVKLSVAARTHGKL